MGIAVLGPLLVDDHEALSPRDQVVLEALVAAGGTALSAESLAEALWAEAPPVSWKKLVPSSVLRLRKLLGQSAIETTAHGYRLAVHGDSIDAVRFVHLVERGHQLLTAGDADRAHHVLREALGLWRGRALAEIADWEPGRFEAERLDEIRREAEEAVLDASLRSGLQAEVVAEARTRVAQEPLRERRWALLALAQYFAGEQADALETLRSARRRLSDELGLDPSAELVRLEEAILRQDASLVAAVALPDPAPECPYPGLRAFDVDDGELFFGRAAELDQCLARLTEQGVLVVVGPSGSGKSSLVRAGVVAALRRSRRPVDILGPGPEILAGLRDLSASQPRSALVVDQLEEVLAACDADAREELISGLVGHARTGPLILTLRADHLGDVADRPELSRLIERGLYLLGPMQEASLRAAIEGPAADAALVLEPGLVDMLIREVLDAPGALPLMAHALEQTWRRREGRTLTVAGYRDSGAIEGAVAQTAEGVFEALGSEDRAGLRDLLLRLVTVTPDGEPLRSWVPLRRLSPHGDRDLVDLLARARLVAVDDGVVAVAHESLARAWPRLRAWLEEDVEGQRILRHLSAAADSWDGLNRPESELYRGVRLARALQWRSRATGPLTPVEDEFLATSEEAERAERDREALTARHRRRQRRTTRGLVAGLVTLVLVAGMTAGVALLQRDRAAEAAVGQRATLAAAAAREAIDPTTALLAAAESVHLRESPDTRGALFGALTRWPALLRSRLHPQTYDLAVGDDGRIALGQDHGVALVDPTSLTEVARQAGSSDSLKLLHDGRRALVGNYHGELAIIDLETGERSPLLAQSDAQAWGLQSSRDSAVLAAGLYSLTDGKSEIVMWRDGTRLPGPVRQSLTDLAVSPDGTRLYLRTASPVASVLVHDVVSGRRLASAPIEGSERAAAPGSGVVEPMVISPDGHTLALGGEQVILIDTATLAVKRHLSNPAGLTVALAFSPDGRRLAGGSGEGTMTVWDVAGGQPDRIEGLPDLVARLAFSPDGTVLYSLTADHRLSAWDITGGRHLVQRVREPLGPGLLGGGIVVPAADGEVVAFMQPTHGADDRGNRIDLLDVTTGKLLEPMVGVYQHRGVWRPPDADHLAVPGDRTIRVWNWRTHEVVIEKDVGEGPVEAVAYTPDGRNLLVGERFGYVFQVDAETLRPTTARIRVAGEVIEIVSAGRDRALAITQSGSSRGYALVDLGTGEVLSSGPLELDLTHANVSPDGTLLAIGGLNGELGILDLESETWVKKLMREHQGPVVRVEFSPDGTQLVSGGDDGRVRLWLARSGAERESVVVGRAGVSAVASFQSDGHTLVMASAGGAVQRWDTRISSWVRHACATAARNLTPEEWTLTFGEEVPFHSPCPTAQGRTVG